MELSLTAAVVLGLLMAGWTIAGVAAILWARAKDSGARSSRFAARRLGRMIEQSPAIPMLVKGDGAIEGSERLASWLGLERMPGFLTELTAANGGLTDADLGEFREAVRRAQKSATPFQMHVTPKGSRRSLAVRGQQADPAISPGASALVWWFDFSEYQDELERLDSDLRSTRDDFAALAGVIEAAPVAMWFRGPDLKLRLVNRAYADAVGVEDEADAIKAQIELIEPQYGRHPAQVAEDARRRAAPVERTVSATIHGQRRAMRVRDIPMGETGVAGFALDVEDQEAHERTLRAHEEARRAMLDLLSAGVAQFDYDRRLVFANKPFRRLFDLAGTEPYEDLAFNRFLDLAREKGRVPETGEYPAWRRRIAAWFESTGPVEEAWTLSDGAHLRVAGLPMPDGGLVLMAEDRTEHLALAATRDTLLRTRATIFDSLSDALAVISPDGRVQSWNRRFLDVWGIDADDLKKGLRVDQLTPRLAEALGGAERAAHVGSIVRAATLDRQQRGEQMALADGSVLAFAGVPLPDGNGLLTMTQIRAPLASAERADLPKEASPAEPTRASVTGNDLDLQDVAPFPFLTALVREREAAVEAKQLMLNLRGSRTGRAIRADADRLGHAIGTLVDRAISTAPERGNLQITLGRTRKGTEIAISGDGFDVETDGPSGEEIELAREIIEAHGGELRVSDVAGTTGSAIIVLA